MSDVDRMLSPGEQVTYRARLHWIIFGPPLIFFVGGLVAVPFHTIAAIGLLLVSIVAIFDAYIKYLDDRDRHHQPARDLQGRLLRPAARSR